MGNLSKVSGANHLLIKVIIAICLFTSLAGRYNFTHAQEGYIYKTYTRDDGLPYNHILDIEKDQTGFMWVSTWDGLSRYDGNEFKTYHHIPGDTTSIPFFVINHVLVDSMNNVWVLCAGRPLMRYNRSRDNFERIGYSGIRDSVEKHILLDSDRKFLWFFIPVDRKLYKYNIENKRFFNISVTGGSGGEVDRFWKDFGDVYSDNRGAFWNIRKSHDGYDILKGVTIDDSTMSFIRMPPLKVTPFKSPDSPSRPVYFDIYVSGSGETWLMTNFGIFVLDEANGQFKEYTGVIDPKEFREKSFCYWFDNYGTAHIIDPVRNSCLKIPSPPGSVFQSVYVDPSGIVWYGTYSESGSNMGLTRMTRIPDYFHHYLTGRDEYGNPFGVFSVNKDINGDIWAGTRGYGYVFRIKPDGEVTRVNLPFPYEGKELPRVRSIISDSSGVWMGCTNNMLYRYDFDKEKFEHWALTLKDSAGRELNLGLHNILYGKREIIISGDGILSFNPATKSLEKKVYNKTSPNFTFVGDRERGYWAGIDRNTVVSFDTAFKETGRYRIGRDFNLIEHVCRGDSNDIWIAIMGGGLGHLDLQTGKMKTYTTADGLSNNTLYSILKDRKGNLWISTNSGISRFNPATRHFKRFGRSEGLLIDEFNSDAVYQSPDGQLFFGGMGGIAGFCPDSIYDRNPSAGPDKVLITDFRISGREQFFDKAVYDLDSIVLKKGDTNFQVAFACLNFVDADKTLYRYRLIGTDSTWTRTDHLNRQVNFTNLGPGSYRLEIEATDPEGEWTSSAALHIRIPFLYYQTIWFKMLIVFVVLALIGIMVALYVWQIRLKAAWMENELAMQNFRGQMNPHFIFNSLNSINYYILTNDRNSAYNYIVDFSRLIMSILHNMHENYIPFEQEVQFIRDYLKLEHLRFGDKFDYVVESNIGEVRDDLVIMTGMIQTFIENAIWHGIRNLEERRGFIKVTFMMPEEKGFIQCCIDDNGVGMKASAQNHTDIPGKKSLGIRIVSERLKLINRIRKTNYQVRFEKLYPTLEETGTRVVIDIPLR